MHVIKMRPAPVRKPSARKLLNLFAPSKSALLTSLALCLSALGISGCGGVVSLSGPKEPTPADSPALAASPNTVDFGSVGLGNSATQKVSLVNKGSDPVQISQLSLSNSVFRVDGAGKLPVTLEAGSSLSLTVHFSPTSDSDSSDQLKVITTSSSAAAAAIGLHGKGAAGSAELAGLTCEQAKLLGPGSDSCTIQTSMAAPSGGMQVHLSSNSSTISVPTSVKVPAGASSVKFAATVAKVSSEETGTITATHGNVAKAFSISLSPAPASSGTPGLKSLVCAETVFTGAGKTSCTVSLNTKSSKAIVVTLATTSSSVSVPPTATIASGSTTVSFTATIAAVSTSQTATISATANGTSRDISLQLKPAKVFTSTPALSLSTSSIQFGDVAIGTAVTRSITVTSSGNAPASITSDSTSGAGFAVSGGNLPTSLKPGQSAVLTVQFRPSASGLVNGKLTIASNAGNQTVSLTGTGTAQAPTLSALNCSTSSIVGSLADSCKVTLSGSAPKGGVTVSLASSSADVKVPASITIPGSSASAAFTANVAAVSTAQTVKLTATAGTTSRSISLQLNPAQAELRVDATTISFGSVILSQTTTQIVTLTSVGKAPVTVKSVSITGVGFSLSSVSLPTTLNPGQKLALSLVFKATMTGSHSGTLTINSNSSTNPTLTLKLTASATGHRVELSWDPPASSAPVSSYKVYRATGGASFVKLAATGQSNYIDTSVQGGTSYKYYVTSVGSSGGESKPSNTFAVTIP